MANHFDPHLHHYFMDGVRVAGITEAMKAEGLSPDLDKVSFRHRKNIEYAGSRGHEIHRACHLDDEGEAHNYTFDPQVEGPLEAWRAFKRDYGFKPEIVERPMYHPVYMFGGTPDSVGPCGKFGRLATVERKSCELQEHFGFQLAGQDILVMNELQVPPTATIAVHLGKDGRYHPREFNFARERHFKALFLAAVAIANYRISKGTL